MKTVNSFSERTYEVLQSSLDILSLCLPISVKILITVEDEAYFRLHKILYAGIFLGLQNFNYVFGMMRTKTFAIGLFEWDEWILTQGVHKSVVI